MARILGLDFLFRTINADLWSGAFRVDLFPPQGVAFFSGSVFFLHTCCRETPNVLSSARVGLPDAETQR